MHELGYTKNIIETVLETAHNSNANQVKAVYLTIGELRDIVDDLFQMCYKHFTEGTIAEGSEAVVKRIPFSVRCNKCGMIYPADIHDDDSFKCIKCGEQDYKLFSGMEFSIDKIEIVSKSIEACG